MAKQRKQRPAQRPPRPDNVSLGRRARQRRMQMIVAIAILLGLVAAPLAALFSSI